MVQVQRIASRDSLTTQEMQGMRSEQQQVHGEEEEEQAQHDCLVEYVHALSGAHEVRTGVWMEHSYARSRGFLPPGAAPRVLLGAHTTHTTHAHHEHIDVECVESTPMPPPIIMTHDVDSDDGQSDEEGEKGWEERVAALAVTAAQARLADCALDVLRSQRLARLAAAGCGVSRCEATRTATRRLRSALAAHWAGSARTPQWLHATLTTHLPRRLRRQYEEVVSKLSSAIPRLAERLGVSRPNSQELRSRPVVGVTRDSDVEVPLLAWVSDERWERRLSALTSVRPLRPPEAASGSPETWCATVAGALRVTLEEIASEAGDRGVVVGGAGSAGAALAIWLAATSCDNVSVRGVVLVAPQLETAEGARDSPEDVLCELRVPMLCVCGGGGASGSRARDLFSRSSRRLLEVRGVDALLRVPRTLRRRAHLTQHALDAAVAEECSRWLLEMAEGDLDDGHSHNLTTIIDSQLNTIDEDSDEEFTHLTAASQTPSSSSQTNTRAIEVSDGRTVTRVSGGTPLALAPPPPRRATGIGSPSGAAGVSVGSRLAPADIMQMPIVFADDAHTTHTAHTDKTTPYSRIIVAKRSGGGVGGGGTVRTRTLLVRRGHAAVSGTVVRRERR